MLSTGGEFSAVALCFCRQHICWSLEERPRLSTDGPFTLGRRGLASSFAWFGFLQTAWTVWQFGRCLFSYFFGSPPVACFCSSITASSLSVDRGLVSAGSSEGTLKGIKLPEVALALRGAHPRLCRAKPAAQVH